MRETTTESGQRRGRALGRRRLCAVTALAIGAFVLKATFPSLRRRAEMAIHARCRRMIHEMEFGEEPSCQMCLTCTRQCIVEWRCTPPRRSPIAVRLSWLRV